MQYMMNLLLLVILTLLNTCLGTFDGKLHVLDVSRKSIHHTFSVDSQIKMTPIFNNDFLYFGTYDGSFYKAHSKV